MTYDPDESQDVYPSIDVAPLDDPPADEGDLESPDAKEEPAD